MRVPTAVGFLAVCTALAGCGTVVTSNGPGGDPAGAAVVAPASANPGDASVTVGADGASGPLTPLTRRASGSVTLRLFTTPSSTASSCAGSGCLPSPCPTTQQLVTELSTPAMVAILNSSVIAPPGTPLALLETLPATGGTAPTTVGTPEASPVQVVTVRAADGVARVTMTTADGSDEAAPVQNLVTLAVPGTSMTGQLVAYDSSNHPLATVPLPAPFTAETPACHVPPTVTAPPPGLQQTMPAPGPQPTDPATATQGVEAAYHTAFTAVSGQPPYASLDGVQDGQDLHGALDQLRRNFATAAATASVVVGRVVFTSPTTATAQFTLSYQDGLPYGTHIGDAVLESGHWLVARDTYCAVLAFGGATCPPG